MLFELKEGLGTLSDLKITCVLGFKHITKRKKFVGKNAKKDVHGTLACENIVADLYLRRIAWSRFRQHFAPSGAGPHRHFDPRTLGMCAGSQERFRSR